MSKPWKCIRRQSKSDFTLRISFVPIFKRNSGLLCLKSYYKNTGNPSNRHRFRAAWPWPLTLTLTLEVTAAVAVTVLEAPDVNLVERRLLPPRLQRGRLKYNGIFPKITWIIIEFFLNKFQWINWIMSNPKMVWLPEITNIYCQW